MKSIVEQLELHEGFRSDPYKDTEGYLTIGYGRNLDAKGISREEAAHLLENDIKEVVKDLKKHYWFTTLDKIRQKVIIDMAFNLGVNGLLSFKKMIQALKEKNYDKTADEMLDSLWAEQVGNRADRLARMMRTGEDYV
ncbi:MAG: glycoside hydrolase family protein [Bacillota bacterium]